MPPKYILTGGMEDDHDKDKQIANLNTEKHNLETQLTEMKDKLGPVTKQPTDIKVPPHTAKEVIDDLKAMHEDDENHKHMQAMDEEHKEKFKALIKAAEEVFEEGNGEPVGNPTEFNTTPTGQTQGEPSTKVKEHEEKIAKLEAKAAQPLIAKIITSKALLGATEDDIKSETERLGKMALYAIEDEFKANKIFIDQAFKAKQNDIDVKALIAKSEEEFDFNGISGSLTGKVISIDEQLEKAIV